MTRDEAIEIIGGEQGWPSIAGGACAAWVDIFAALGMLKLDEPKSANQRARDQFRNESLSTYEGEIYIGAIERAGLKIVEQ